MRLALLAILAFVGAGCSSGPLVRNAPDAGPAAGYPTHTAAQIVAAVRAGVAPVRSAAADGDITLSWARTDQDASFSLRARLEDSLTVVVRGPLGIEGGRGVVTADSVLAVDRINEVLYLGRVETADRYVPGAGTPEQIARAALGLLVPEATVAWTVEADSGRYTLAGRLPTGTRREYVVDPALWRVVTLREYGADGRLVAVQEAEAFDTVEGVVLPRRVRLTGDGVRVVLEHRRLVPNPPDLRLRFRRPDGYREVPIE